MKKFEGYLIVSDIDGTLFDHSFNCPSVNLEAIEYFKSEGGLFTLASGRTLGDAAKLGEGLCNTEVIGFNGAAIGNRDRIIKSFPFPEGLREDLMKLISLQDWSDLEFLTPNGIKVYRPNEFTALHQQYVSDNEFVILQDLNTIPKDALMAALWMDEEKVPLAKELALKLQLDEKYQVVIGYKLALEIIAKEGGKGNSALELKRLTGCHTLITAGDNFNDITMLRAADISFAPSDADPRVRAAATHPLKASCYDGIYHEILKILEAMQ